MQVRLPNNIPRNSPWLIGLIGCLSSLSDYGLADVEMVEAKWLGRELLGGKIPRWQQNALIQVNGRYVTLDVWDFAVPSRIILENLDHPEMPELAAVVKIQCHGGDCWNHYRIPVVPWSMFHKDQLNWLKNLPRYREIVATTPKTFRAGFTGCNWPCRRKWVEALEKIDGVDLDAWPMSERKHRPGTVEDYVRRIATWECAICLKGKTDKWTDGKNRREVEFAGLGIPMILNYAPKYFNKLGPSYHYALLAEPRSIDLEQAIEYGQHSSIGKLAFDWWNANASREGICRSFVKLMGSLGI